MQGTGTKLVSKAVINTIGQTVVSDRLDATRCLIVGFYIGNTPLSIGIYNQTLLFNSKEACWLRIYGEDTCIKDTHIVHKGNFDVQAGLYISFDQLTKL